MRRKSPLHLGKIDPPVWRVIVDETGYGPYNLGQLRRFVSEGRITETSLIAEGPEGRLRRAKDIQRLSDLFQPVAHPEAEPAKPSAADANYIINTQLSDTNEIDFIRALNALGSFAEALPGTYVLRSHQRLATVQKALSEAIGPSDQLLIANTTTNRLAWVNLGPDADQSLRQTWASADDDQDLRAH
ncbi:MAG: hypothetical protein AAFQ84_05905 [Pseudomonadota bacterium]